MKTCHICGNEFSVSENSCPFCNTSNTVKKTSNSKIKKIITYNIKSDMPTTDQAYTRLLFKIRHLKESGNQFVKIIHGYGSSGVGGELRYSVREQLKKMQHDRLIRNFLPGEDFSMLSPKGQKIIKQFPRLKEDKDFRKSNKGITLVVI
jgi:hypothetical protein